MPCPGPDIINKQAFRLVETRQMTFINQSEQFISVIIAITLGPALKVTNVVSVQWWASCLELRWLWDLIPIPLKLDFPIKTLILILSLTHTIVWYVSLSLSLFFSTQPFHFSIHFLTFYLNQFCSFLSLSFILFSLTKCLSLSLNQNWFFVSYTISYSLLLSIKQTAWVWTQSSSL